jgi:hypothetical protein
VIYYFKLFFVILFLSSCVENKNKNTCKILPVDKINNCYNYKNQSSIWCNVVMGNGNIADISAPLHVGEERRVCKEINIELY